MKSLKPKIAIIGAGNVGSTFAFSLMISGLAREIVLVDKNELLAKGECMDLNHGLSFAHPTKIYAAGFEGCKDADIVVITAGAKQKPGQSRIDLVQNNVTIFKDIIPAISKYSGNAILLVVTNPVDILTYVTLKISGLPSNRVIGSGTVLDTARLKYMISEYYKVDPGNIHAYIIGEHGDTELPVKIKRKEEETLHELYIELVKLQKEIISSNLKLLVILEGRDAAGKDGTIKRIIKHLSPRETRVVVALGKPSDRQELEWYFQRYSIHLPVSGEFVLLNRSWYNRAGVEKVMGFCTEKEYKSFFTEVELFEKMLVDAGFIILKYYLDISKEEQERRLKDREKTR